MNLKLVVLVLTALIFVSVTSVDVEREKTTQDNNEEEQFRYMLSFMQVFEENPKCAGECVVSFLLSISNTKSLKRSKMKIQI
jgi:hypothetical protein